MAPGGETLNEAWDGFLNTQRAVRSHDSKAFAGCLF